MMSLSLLFAQLLLLSAADEHKGLNLPSMKADTNQGNFLPGLFVYNYNTTYFDDLKRAGFTSVRLGLNVETAMDEDSLAKLRTYVDALGGTGILCMWDTLKTGETGHGDGRVNDVVQMGQAWGNVLKHFADTQVKFEVFNEPFGYNRDAAEYMAEMQAVIHSAGLPPDRVILDGVGYADDVVPVAKAGWSGLLAFHIYPNWLADGQRTQENFSNLVQDRLKGYSTRVYITEFGAALDKDDYNTYNPSGNAGDVNVLRGLDDAVSALQAEGKGLRGVYHWHGRDNGDSYSFWGPHNAKGAAKVQLIANNC